ncbi:MAG: glycoside hydrolase family 2 TIM barrel-domain containing protein [Anaerolineae bacterium]
MAHRHLDLNGEGWRLGRAPATADAQSPSWDELQAIETWLPATVPGNVRADLARAGQLPDLHIGTRFQAARWVDEHCWWLVRDLELEVDPGERVHLVLRGVDYISDLYVNGNHLGRHEGMFSPQVHDITPLLAGRNRLAVRLLGARWLPQDRSSPGEKLLNRIEARLGGMPGEFPQRRDTLKCQMNFGWDFAPPLRPVGIWDDVYARVSGGVFIRDVIATPHPDDGPARLLIEVELDADAPREVRLECVLAPQTFEGRPTIVEQAAQVRAGPNRLHVEMEVSEPQLWWPWDHGRPDLYRLSVRILDAGRPLGAGYVLDSVSRPLGLRRVELETADRAWTLRVNGRPVYARGSNWVPANILPGEVRRADYEQLLALVRRANMNLLRVWGGGLREKRAFYDLCDRQGILVWQEFPFACAFLTRFPRSPDYLALAETEARAIVRDLRRHPCLALWCGGNEFSPRRNAPLVRALRRAVDQEDPSRPFLPASPAGGDSHYWQVWHSFQPPSAYRRDRPGFASEFGMQAPPAIDSLRRFLPEDDLWPPGPSWTAHSAGLDKLWRYARPFLPAGDVDLETFVRASQQAQARGLQIAVEHYRRLKARGCGGVLVWQLNEPWPAISWALLDFFRQPKPAYETVRRAMNPVLVSLEYPLRHYRAGEDLEFDVWLINDRPEPLAGCRLEVRLWDPDGRPAEELVQAEPAVDVPAGAARVVARLRWSLAWPTTEGDGGHLTCRLLQGDRILSANEYELGHHDDVRPTWRQRLWAWLSGPLMPS